MPWASLQFALKNHSIDLNSLVLLHGLTHDQALKAFCGGKADFIHVPEPNASNLIDSGAADLAVALGPENGHDLRRRKKAGRFGPESGDLLIGHLLFSRGRHRQPQFPGRLPRPGLSLRNLQPHPSGSHC